MNPLDDYEKHISDDVQEWLEAEHQLQGDLNYNAFFYDEEGNFHYRDYVSYSNDTLESRPTQRITVRVSAEEQRAQAAIRLVLAAAVLFTLALVIRYAK